MVVSEGFKALYVRRLYQLLMVENPATRTLDDGNYGMFLLMGHAGCLSSTVCKETLLRSLITKKVGV